MPTYYCKYCDRAFHDIELLKKHEPWCAKNVVRGAKKIVITWHTSDVFMVEIVPITTKDIHTSDMHHLHVDWDVSPYLVREWYYYIYEKDDVDVELNNVHDLIKKDLLERANQLSNAVENYKKQELQK